MRINWPIIKFLLALLFTGFLFGYGTQRNSKRKLAGLEVAFTDQNPPFITIDAVNKMLIQNADSVTSVDKETLVLKEVENRLKNNAMIRNAEVFITVDGILKAEIEQRKPLARILGSPDHYLDQDGKKMPLSDVYTERVPIISGTFSDSLALTRLLSRIDSDDFLRLNVIGLNIHGDNMVEILLRDNGMHVRFGKPEHIDLKFRNFKTFYKKVQRDTLANKYQHVDLRFGNQVVATKK